MEKILFEIYKLRLDLLPSDWVDSVFYFEFTGFQDIPREYEDLLDSIEIQTVFESLLEYINEAEDSEENTWASLSLNISYRNLLAVIGHYIKYGTDNVTVRERRNNALLAARVYFRLLLIPGARAYNVYHSQLFAHSISCLGFPRLLCEKSDHYRSNKHLSNEVNFVLKMLSEYVMDLKRIVLQLKLTPSDINYEEILSNLIDVTGGAITQTLISVDRILLSNVSSVIYQVINSMICKYGECPNPNAIELLFKCMVPKLIASSLDNKVPTGYVRASYVTYAGFILTSYCKASVKSFTVMLEHICYTPELLERAESRNARADLVVGLMSLLPDRRHRKFVKWVLILSTTAKVVHRHIALEILSRLLNNEPEINEQRETIRNEIEKQNAASNALPNGCGGGGADGGPTPMDLDDSSQDSQMTKENEETEDDEVAGLLRLAPHTVPLGQILHAVYDCAADVSSTIRQRALAVLAESVASQRTHMRRALAELNGEGAVSRLMALAARSVCDERAIVRRGAVALVQRLLSSPAPPPTLQDLQILVGLCRDAAITVRAAAISALGELVVNRPSNAVLDAFLKGPVHQLSDPETKVQDQVKSLIEQIVFKRLVKYAGEGCLEDLHPWIFLEGIIRNNMRRNLQNACALLASTENCISVRLVDILSSHLGAKDDRRDLQCLVLLTCVARHVDYSDIGFLLDYYYKLAEIRATMFKAIADQELTPRISDCRLMTMVLELLSSWAKFAKPPDSARLRNHLVQQLAATIDDGCRIPTVMLAKELDPKNLVWASELMQLSEQATLSTGSIHEALRVADLSLVAPASPLPAILQLFLSFIKTPPTYWNETLAGDCVAGVGRLCLRSRAAAEEAAPVLAALLHSDAPLPARVNALLALADCSQRYANIVEPLLGTICRCLEPHTPAKLRRAAVRSLTELLLSGYLRLRTPLYYNYFALIADPDHEVREPAEYYVTSCLKVDTIFQNFVDCVLHYNTGSDTLDFDARQLIYDVMLQRMSLVQKLNMQCRLAREILGHAADLADNAEEIPDNLHAAMLDTIKLLTGPRMKLPRKPQPTGDVADIDDIQERVTTNIVSHKMKRTVAEVMVPAVMRLYARLGAAGGQLAAYLVMLAQDLEVDYKDEIDELIDNDEELVTRIAYFRENHTVESTTGNMRNLVTTSGPPEPETPKPQRKRALRREPPKKRTLKI